MFALVRDMPAQDPAYRPTHRVCLASNLVRCHEQSVEEPVEHAGGLVTIGELGPAEAIGLVSGGSQFRVGGDHFGIACSAGASVVVGAVLDAVDLKYNPAVPVEQQQEVHPLPGQSPSSPAVVRIVVHVDLRYVACVRLGAVSFRSRGFGGRWNAASRTRAPPLVISKTVVFSGTA
jgi:hypothetical protein